MHPVESLAHQRRTVRFKDHRTPRDMFTDERYAAQRRSKCAAGFTACLKNRGVYNAPYQLLKNYFLGSPGQSAEAPRRLCRHELLLLYLDDTSLVREPAHRYDG